MYFRPPGKVNLKEECTLQVMAAHGARRGTRMYNFQPDLHAPTILNSGGIFPVKFVYQCRLRPPSRDTHLHLCRLLLLFWPLNCPTLRLCSFPVAAAHAPYFCQGTFHLVGWTNAEDRLAFMSQSAINYLSNNINEKARPDQFNPLSLDSPFAPVTGNIAV